MAPLGFVNWLRVEFRKAKITLERWPTRAIRARRRKKPGFLGEAGLLKIPENMLGCGLGRL
jgi:hypothetical protein